MSGCEGVECEVTFAGTEMFLGRTALKSGGLKEILGSSREEGIRWLELWTEWKETCMSK